MRSNRTSAHASSSSCVVCVIISHTGRIGVDLKAHIGGLGSKRSGSGAATAARTRGATADRNKTQYIKIMISKSKDIKVPK